MPVDITIILPNHPGSLADVCEGLGQLGVNIEGLCAFASQGIGMLHVTVEDSAAAQRAIEQSGLKVNEVREVVVLEMEEEPGSAGHALRRIGDAGVDLDLVYMATGTRLVLAAAELEKARAALGL